MKPEIIHLNESLLMIDLPVGAKAQLGGGCYGCRKVNMWHCAHADTCGNTHTTIQVRDAEDELIHVVDLPGTEVKYEIVGTGTLSSDLAEKIAALCGGVTLLSKLSTDPHESLETRPATLEEVIESKGYHLRNPHKEPKMPNGYDPKVWDPLGSEYRVRYIEWQAAEAKTLKNPVFIKIIKP